MDTELPRLLTLPAVTRWLTRALDTVRVGGAAEAADITLLHHHERSAIDQLLGEGEVCLKRRDGEQETHIQEAVLPGIWRSRRLDDQDRLLEDHIEVGEIPNGVRRSPDPACAAQLEPSRPPAEALNAAPILTELAAQVKRWRRGSTAYTINLTLLPMSPADREFLDRQLGSGPVETLLRGYGDCRVTSAACPGIWRICYTNAMGRVILDTLEVTDIPAVLCAAAEDLDDSRRRLPDLLEELPRLASRPAEGESAA